MHWLKSLRDQSGLRSVCWLFITGLLVSCQSQVNVTEMPPGPYTIENILVIPFQDVSVLEGESVIARSPVSGRVFITGEVAVNATNFLTDYLISWLQRNTAYEIELSGLSSDRQAALYSANDIAVSTKQALAQAGRRHDADGVLVGYLYRFQKRVGRGFSIESPASVAFDLHLIRVADQAAIWSANFEETQQSLSENIFQLGSFLQRGGRWVTAEEMATAGMDKILKKFPKS